MAREIKNAKSFVGKKVFRNTPASNSEVLVQSNIIDKVSENYNADGSKTLECRDADGDVLDMSVWTTSFTDCLNDVKDIITGKVVIEDVEDEDIAESLEIED